MSTLQKQYACCLYCFYLFITSTSFSIKNRSKVKPEMALGFWIWLLSLAEDSSFILELQVLQGIWCPPLVSLALSLTYPTHIYIQIIKNKNKYEENIFQKTFGTISIIATFLWVRNEGLENFQGRQVHRAGLENTWNLFVSWAQLPVRKHVSRTTSTMTNTHYELFERHLGDDVYSND